MNLADAVAAQQHRLLAHPRLEEVARLRDLARVADEQPGAAEQVIELVAVRLLAHEDFATDRPPRRVDMASYPRWFMPALSLPRRRTLVNRLSIGRGKRPGGWNTIVNLRALVAIERPPSRTRRRPRFGPPYILLWDSGESGFREPTETDERRIIGKNQQLGL